MVFEKVWRKTSIRVSNTSRSMENIALSFQLRNRSNIKMVIEAANLPTLPSVGEHLHKNGVWIIPDFIANAGGVIGSFVEYQGRTEKEAFELIKSRIINASCKKYSYRVGCAR